MIVDYRTVIASLLFLSILFSVMECHINSPFFFCMRYMVLGFFFRYV